MMNEDTKNYTSEQLSAELEKLGSSVGVSNTSDAIVFTVQSLKKNLDKTLKMLEERMLNPKFSEEAFTRIKRQLGPAPAERTYTTGRRGHQCICAAELWHNNILGIPGKRNGRNDQQYKLLQISSLIMTVISGLKMAKWW
jgi:zinc protease